MANPAFDTTVRSLEASGLPRAQARAIAEAARAGYGELATKADLKDAKADLKDNLARQADVAGIQASIDGLKDNLASKAEIASLAASINGLKDNLASKSELSGLETRLVKYIFGRIVAVVALIGAAIVAAIKYLPS